MRRHLLGYDASGRLDTRYPVWRYRTSCNRRDRLSVSVPPIAIMERYQYQSIKAMSEFPSECGREESRPVKGDEVTDEEAGDEVEVRQLQHEQAELQAGLRKELQLLMM